MNPLARKLILGALCAVLLTHCSTPATVSLNGKWTVEEVNISPYSEGIHQILKAELESMIFDFKEDGLLLHSDFFRAGALGSWNLNAERDTLICSYMYERATYTDKYRVEITANEISLSTSDFETTDTVELTVQKR
tara:strand:- start:9905 stop:10312 length:408 start_codon:yes stop_codon:yes gene_type:complete